MLENYKVKFTFLARKSSSWPSQVEHLNPQLGFDKLHDKQKNKPHPNMQDRKANLQSRSFEQLNKCMLYITETILKQTIQKSASIVSSSTGVFFRRSCMFLSSSFIKHSTNPGKMRAVSSSKIRITLQNSF